MYKLKTKILSLFLSAVSVILFCSGCNLVSTNRDGDLNQVVATVSLNGVSDDIYKRELILNYNSYGYIYTYYGYEKDYIYDYLLNNLERAAAKVLYVKLALTSKTTDRTEGFFSESFNVAEENKTEIDKLFSGKNYKGVNFADIKYGDSADMFLSEYEYAKCRYTILNNVEGMILTYIDDKENYKSNPTASNSRTTLTVEEDGNEWQLKNDEKYSSVSDDYRRKINTLNVRYNLGLNINSYVTKYDLNYAFYKAYADSFDVKSPERAIAIKRALTALKDKGYINLSEKVSGFKNADDILSINAFRDDLEKQCEDIILKKYELAIENTSVKDYKKDSKIYNEYSTLFDSQEKSYADDSAYKSALDDADTFVVYHPGETNGEENGYGYVSHILLGFSAEQKKKVDKQYSRIETYGEDFFISKRNELLSELTVKDQRSPWVLSEYGHYDSDTGFIFDKDYVKTTNRAINVFKGTLSDIKEFIYADGVKDATVGKAEATEMDFKSFYTDIVVPVMGFNADLIGDNKLTTGEIYQLEDCTTVSFDKAKVLKEDVLNAFRDIIYGYSTDSDELKEYYGYVYSPNISVSGELKYFFNAVKSVVEKGVGAYTVVATNEGYEIIICSKKTVTNTNKLTEGEFNESLKDKESLAYKFLKLNSDKVVKTATDGIITNFNNIGGGVVPYPKTYKDLLK